MNPLLLAADGFSIAEVVEWFTDGSHWSGTNGVPHRLFEHVLMSVAACVTAAVLALPVGTALGHIGRGGFALINISNIGRAIPSFALLVLGATVFGIGGLPAYIALVALAVPPLVTNSYVGVREVDPEAKEAAQGMGMTARQVLWRVELPLALPMVFAGLRTSAVQVVATATIAAVIGWGGLGRYILDGLGQRDFVQVFAGAVLVALLSVLTEVALSVLQRLVVSSGLRASDESVKNETFAGAAEALDPVRG